MASEPTTAGAAESTSPVIPKPEKPKTLYRSFKKSLSKGVKGVRASVENMATVVRSGSFRSQSGRRDGKTTAEVAAEDTNEIATGTESASKPVEAPEPVSAQVLPSDSVKDVSDDVKVQDVSGAAAALDVKPEDVGEDARTVEDSVRMHAGVITGKFEDGLNTTNDVVEQAVDGSNKAAEEVSAVVEELVEDVATEARAQEAEVQEQKAAAQEAAAGAVADAEEEVAAAAEDVKETAANAVAETEDAAAALVADAKGAAADAKETATAATEGLAAAVDDGAQAAVEQAAAFGSPVVLPEEAASMPEAIEQPAGGAEASAEQMEEEAGEADEKAPLEEEGARGLTDADLLANGVEGAPLQAFGSPVGSQVDEHVKAGYTAPVITDSPQQLNKDVRLALNPRASEEDAVDISVKVVATEPARKSAGSKKAMLPSLLVGGLVVLVVRKLAGGSAPAPAPAPVQKKRMAMW